MKLEALRKKIDTYDKKILRILGMRILLSQEIGRVKEARGIPIEDEKREKEILENGEKQAKMLKLDPEFVRKVYKLVLEESKRKQGKRG